MSLNIAVLGAAGRMGREILEVVAAMSPERAPRLVAAVVAPGHPWLDRSVAAMVPALAEAAAQRAALAATAQTAAPASAPTDPLPRFTDDMAALVGADVVIDFSRPGGTLAALQATREAGTPIVIGTTGFATAERGLIEAHAETRPVLLSANMSLGVNLLAMLVEQAAAALGPDFDIEVVEAHHRRKADAPSGTALLLARAAAMGRGWDLERVAQYGRHGLTGERPQDQLGIHAVRAGGIVGDHEVLFAGETESITLAHRAFDRAVFARGAIDAALWLHGRPPGLYSMRDVLAERLAEVAARAVTTAPGGPGLPPPPSTVGN